MHAMQDTPDKIEPIRPELPRHFENVTFVLEAIVWVLIIGYVLGRMYETEEMRLHILHVVMRLAQQIASHIGVLALLAEKAYNDTAASMH
jgi:hypothetical protein